MKTKILIAALTFLVIYGCNKSGSSSKPGLSLKSVNGTSFNANDNISFSFNFTVPKGGSVTDTLFIKKKYLSCTFKSYDTAYFPIPGFVATSDQKAVMDYSYIYSLGQSITGGCNNSNGIAKTDSVYFYFWLKDKDGNTSDTVTSPKIILK